MAAGLTVRPKRGNRAKLQDKEGRSQQCLEQDPSKRPKANLSDKQPRGRASAQRHRAIRSKRGHAKCQKDTRIGATIQAEANPDQWAVRNQRHRNQKGNRTKTKPQQSCVKVMEPQRGTKTQGPEGKTPSGQKRSTHDTADWRPVATNARRWNSRMGPTQVQIPRRSWQQSATSQQPGKESTLEHLYL